MTKNRKCLYYNSVITVLMLDAINFLQFTSSQGVCFQGLHRWIIECHSLETVNSL
jgi:hypothetical protein